MYKYKGEWILRTTLSFRSNAKTKNILTEDIKGIYVWYFSTPIFVLSSAKQNV